MNILCMMFGHKPPVYAKKGWYSPGQEYAKVRECGVDGVGRRHGEVTGECARCKKEFRMARIHIPKVGANES